MPIIIITGLPSSGKSTIANRINDAMKQRYSDATTCIIKDENCSDTPVRQHYGVVSMEKQWRAKQRRTISQMLQKNVIISDSLNYIKGYRYELYCLAKNAHQNNLTVYICADVETCKYLNSLKNESEERYTNEKIDELAQRYEVPNSDNRWDSPMVKIDISQSEGRLPRDVELNFDHVFDLLFNGEKAKPNDCTVPKVEHNTNKLNEMQVITQQIIQAILEKQSMNFGLDKIQVPHSTIPYFCKKNRNMPQLTRAKAQFLQVLKGNEAIGVDSVGNHFVEFLNTL